MRKEIQDRYEKLAAKVGIEEGNVKGRAYSGIIRKSLRNFVNTCNNPAIWCMGYHTRMLMADFMNELKTVRFIIDNKVKLEKSGFQIITEDEVVMHDIDGIIISTIVYNEEIKETIKKKFPQIPYMDIYDELEKNGIILQSSYYMAEHPYSRYKLLNRLQRDLDQESNAENIKKILKLIVKEYITIKDFKTAIPYAEKLADEELLTEIKEIYREQKEMLSAIAGNNVLMFCVDGLRRRDVLEGKMPRFLQWLDRETYLFDNAYSMSTSTYESLIPTYMENSDLRTEYYKERQIPVEKCRFISEALRQHRDIYFYTDIDEFVACDEIHRSGRSQTATEKFWDFALDAYDTDNGLFYLHILYESHYSYPNPYTKNELIADGTSIMFDYLEAQGGKLRTDYTIQQRDTLAYLDSVVPPLLELVDCRIVLYADHGNILLSDQKGIDSMEGTKWTFHKDLIEIPFAIKAPELRGGRDNKIISLMELSSVLSCLLEKRKYVYEGKKYIKVVRSQIYNPDFGFLYREYGHEKDLQAFELFLFPNGYRLAIYADGSIKLFLDEAEQDDKELCSKLYYEVEKDITVCDTHLIEKSY